MRKTHVTIQTTITGSQINGLLREFKKSGDPVFASGDINGHAKTAGVILHIAEAPHLGRILVMGIEADVSEEKSTEFYLAFRQSDPQSDWTLFPKGIQLIDLPVHHEASAGQILIYVAEVLGLMGEAEDAEYQTNRAAGLIW